MDKNSFLATLSESNPKLTFVQKSKDGRMMKFKSATGVEKVYATKFVAECVADGRINVLDSGEIQWNTSKFAKAEWA